MKSAAVINRWVNEVTNGKISSLVDSESLSTAVMLLINAVYFRGLWRFPFEETVTKDFYIDQNAHVKKEFAEQTGTFYYYYSKNLEAKILRLPYEGGRFSMFLVLPFEVDGLGKIIETLSAETLNDEVSRMEEISVHVVLPKFRFDSSTNLNNIIRKVWSCCIVKSRN